MSIPWREIQTDEEFWPPQRDLRPRRRLREGQTSRQRVLGPLAAGRRSSGAISDAGTNTAATPRAEKFGLEARREPACEIVRPPVGHSEAR
jgi:hypothetical protein